MGARRPSAIAVLCLAGACGGAPSAASGSPSAAPESCPAEGVAVQVLGSGGPIADDGRASSGYLVWVDGRARLLVDVGGGTIERFPRAGAREADLDAVLLTHLHVDHVVDLPALLKSASFGRRRRPLTLVGPTGRPLFPSTAAHLTALFGDEGAFPYLGWMLDGEGRFRLQVVDVDPSARDATVVLEGDLVVHAVGVPHGPVPALGFRVDVGGVVLGFGGDQRLDDPRFAELVRDADLVVVHAAVGASPDPVASRLHATPAAIGDFGARARVGQLVLSHLMARSLRDLDANVAAIRSRYDGEVVVAEDLGCYVPDRGLR